MNHASIAEQKKAGVGGKFGSKTSSAPSGSLAGSAQASGVVPAEFDAVWGGPPELAAEAYDHTVLSMSRAPLSVTRAANEHGPSRVLEMLGSDESDTDVSATLGLTEDDVAAARDDLEQMYESAESAVKIAEQKGIRLRTRAEGGVPSQFDAMGDVRPNVLWTKGDASLLDRLDESVTVTGSRACTAYGEHVARELSAAFAERGTPVVSSLNYGVDGAATRGAMTGGGQVIGVVPSGIDRVYPAGHAHLYQQVESQGVLLSAHGPGLAPSRDRIEHAGLMSAAAAPATLIVEGALKSGAYTRARAAHEMGRTVYAVPGPITSLQSQGPNTLISEGIATAITSSTEME